MGQFISQMGTGAARDSPPKKRKRSSSPSELDELNEALDASMRSPKKQVLLPRYISHLIENIHISGRN